MITKFSRGSQYFIFEEEQLKDLLDTKNVLCNEDLDSEAFAFVVYSKYQDMQESDDFVCTVKVADKFDRFIRKGIRVIVPEGTKYLEVYPWMYLEMQEKELDNGDLSVSVILPNDQVIPLEKLCLEDNTITSTLENNKHASTQKHTIKDRIADSNLSQGRVDTETSQEVA